MSHFIIGLYFAVVSAQLSTEPPSLSGDFIEMLREFQSDSRGWALHARGKGTIEEVCFEYTQAPTEERVRLTTHNYANEYLGRLAEFITSDSVLREISENSSDPTLWRLLKQLSVADVLVVLLDAERLQNDLTPELTDVIEIVRDRTEATVLPVSTKTDIFAKQFRQKARLNGPERNYDAFREFVHAQWRDNSEFAELLSETPYSMGFPVYFMTTANENGNNVLNRSEGEDARPSWFGFDHVLRELSDPLHHRST